MPWETIGHVCKIGIKWNSTNYSTTAQQLLNLVPRVRSLAGLLVLGCSIRHLAVPFDIWLFHSTFGLFHSTFGCSIWHLAVPFDIWLVPFDIWLFRFACVASLFVFNLNHLTNIYSISSRMARPNRCSLYHFDESEATCNYAEPFEVCLFCFTYAAWSICV